MKDTTKTVGELIDELERKLELKNSTDDVHKARKMTAEINGLKTKILKYCETL